MKTQSFLTNYPVWVSRALASANEEIAYHYGVVVTEVRLTRQRDGWRVMVKGVLKNECVVAFTSAESYSDAVEFLGYSIESGTLTFKPDKYPVKLGTNGVNG